MKKTIISIIGPSQPTKDVAETAYKLGKLIGERGWVLLSGGRTGVAEWASRGAKESGGITVGILPEVTHETANPYVDIVIPTGMHEARNFLVVNSGDAVIAVGTSFGTISEMAMALRIGKFMVGLHIPKPFILPVRDAVDPEEAVSIVAEYLEGRKR